MNNDFFDNHSMLGSMFDFDRDGSLDFGEAMFMGSVGAAIVDEEERASRKSEREWHVWDDDNDDEWESDSEDDGW